MKLPTGAFTKKNQNPYNHSIQASIIDKYKDSVLFPLGLTAASLQVLCTPDFMWSDDMITLGIQLCCQISMRFYVNSVAVLPFIVRNDGPTIGIIDLPDPTINIIYICVHVGKLDEGHWAALHISKDKNQ